MNHDNNESETPMTPETRVYRVTAGGEQLVSLALDGATAASEIVRRTFSANDRDGIALLGQVAVEDLGPALPGTTVCLGEVESR